MQEFLKKKNIINLLLLGIMVLAVPITVRLVRLQQVIFSRAAEGKVEFLSKEFGGTDCVITRGGKQVAVCKDLAVRFTVPTGADIRLLPRTTPTPIPTVTSVPTVAPTAAPTASPVSSPVVTATPQPSSPVAQLTATPTCSGPHSGPFSVSNHIDLIIDARNIPTSSVTWYTLTDLSSGQKIYLSSVQSSNNRLEYHGEVLSIRTGSNIVLRSGMTYQVEIRPGAFTEQIPTLGDLITQTQFSIACITTTPTPTPGVVIAGAIPFRVSFDPNFATIAGQGTVNPDTGEVTIELTLPPGAGQQFVYVQFFENGVWVPNPPITTTIDKLL